MKGTRVTIKLYGMPLSNYYNMVKTVLLEKGMDFEEVLILPNQESDFLGKSPMGKVPAMETEQGFLTETGVMIDYLDSLGQGESFYPVVRPLKSSTKFFFFLIIDPLHAGIESLNPLNTTSQSAVRQEVLTKRTEDWIAMNRKSTANLRNT